MTEQTNTETREPYELRVQTPPGWIEFAAHEDDAAAERSFVELIEPYREHLDPAEYKRSVDVFRTMRAVAVQSGFQVSGALLAAWHDAPTVWTYGVRVMGLADNLGFSLAGLLERVFRSKIATGSDKPEEFKTVDGRVGSALVTTAELDPRAREASTAPEVLSDTMGMCVATVPLPGIPDAAALVVGASPTVDERDAMSVIASVMVHSVHVVGGDLEHEIQVVDASFEESFGLAEAGAANG